MYENTRYFQYPYEISLFTFKKVSFHHCLHSSIVGVRNYLTELSPYCLQDIRYVWLDISNGYWRSSTTASWHDRAISVSLINAWKNHGFPFVRTTSSIRWVRVLSLFPTGSQYSVSVVPRTVKLLIIFNCMTHNNNNRPNRRKSARKRICYSENYITI